VLLLLLVMLLLLLLVMLVSKPMTLPMAHSTKGKKSMESIFMQLVAPRSSLNSGSFNELE
jgi:hypothetical protein